MLLREWRVDTGGIARAIHGWFIGGCVYRARSRSHRELGKQLPYNPIRQFPTYYERHSLMAAPHGYRARSGQAPKLWSKASLRACSRRRVLSINSRRDRWCQYEFFVEFLLLANVTSSRVLYAPWFPRPDRCNERQTSAVAPAVQSDVYI